MDTANNKPIMRSGLEPERMSWHALGDRVMLVMSSNNLLYMPLRDTGFKVETPCKGTGPIAKVLRAIWVRGRLPFKEAWYNKRVCGAAYRIIVVMEGYLTTKEYLTWLKQRHPNSKFVFCYRNPVACTIHPDKIPDGYEVWSFDKSDCNKFGLRYMEGTYFPQGALKKQTPIYDVFFVGKDKGRGKELHKIENFFCSLGLTPYFHIVPNWKWLIWRHAYYKPAVPYSEVRKGMAQSRAILDYLQHGQTGITVRAMECIFNEIKLITNNPAVREYEFYDPQNVFILGEDDEHNLRGFVMSAYKSYKSEVLENFLFISWLRSIAAEV